MLKIFFTMETLGLLVPVLTSRYMAWRFSRRSPVLALVLPAGMAVPPLPCGFR
ncbi:MAG: hypothetical protein WC617_10000 [Rhodanobacter sp.]|jgi:hypothetical protein